MEENKRLDKNLQFKELFRNKNFVASWVHSIFYLTASNVIQFVLSLYVLDETGSGVAFASLLSIIIFPRLIFTPIGGVLGDRYNRLQILKIVTFFALVLTLIFLIAIQVLPFSLLIIYIFVILLEIGEIFHRPAYEAILPEIIPKEHLSEAASLRIFQVGITTVLSSAIGGFFYELLGVTRSFIITVALFGLSWVVLFFLKYKSLIKKEKIKIRYFSDLKDSIQVVMNNSFFKNFVFYSSAISLFFTSEYMVTIFIMKSVFNYSGGLIGIYRAIFGIVYVATPLIFAKQIKQYSVRKLLWVLTRLLSIGIGGLGLIIFFGLKDILPLFSVYILIIILDSICVGLMGPLHVALQVFKQTNIPKEYFGRIISIISFANIIAVPLGQFCYGFLIKYTPLYFAYILSTLMIFIISIWGRSAFDGIKSEGGDNKIEV